MAAGLPDAKLVVRLDTKQAERDLSKLQKKEAKGPKGAALTPEAARFGKPEQGPVAAARMRSDNDDRALSLSAVNKTSKSVLETLKKASEPLQEIY